MRVPVPSRRRLLGLAALLAFVAVAAVASPARTFDAVRGVIDSPWFPVVLVGLYAVRPFLAWPVMLLSALVGYRYGLLLGVPVALVGAVATSLLPFYAGRYLSAESGLLGRATAGSAGYFEHTGDVRGVTAARLAPTPAEAVSTAAGAGGVTLSAFALGTLAGELPWTVVAVGIGASLDHFTISAVHADPLVVAALAAVGVATLLGPAYAWWRDR